MAKDEKTEMGQDHQGKEPSKTMKGPPKAANHKEHDEMLHKAMPPGYKGDCGY
jgi:hypothetical protein